MNDKLSSRPTRKSLKQVFFLLNGVLFAYVLNMIFSMSKASPLYEFVIDILIMFLWLGWTDRIIYRFPEFNSYMKIRAILLGASITSVILAYINYRSIVSASDIQLNAVIYSIFRSILLASLFSFLERLVKYLEDQKKP
jgi:hypothetical protein